MRPQVTRPQEAFVTDFARKRFLTTMAALVHLPKEIKIEVNGKVGKNIPSGR
jgi:hypothetical protein